MARRALSSAQLAVVQAVERALAASGAAGRPRADGDSRGAGEPRTAGVLRLGVSGGADSMALAAAVAHALRDRTPTCCVEALVVDHGLFPGSAEHTTGVVDALTGLGLAAGSVRVEVRGPGGPEDAARRARHRALWRTPTASGGPVREVWLAHTRDDQAEQVLLGLARGSGTRSLAGMPGRRPAARPDAGGADAGGADADMAAGQVVRPLLCVSREATVAACRDWGIEAWNDPANADPRFRRSALRGALPALAAVLGVDLTANLCRTADLARQDADLLDDLAERAASTVATAEGLVVRRLLAEPAALQSRVVHRWLRQQGSPAARAHVEAVLGLVLRWHGQGPVDAGNGVRISRRDGLLVSVQPAVTALA